MNVISSLTAIALPEIQAVAALVNLEIVEEGGLFTVYRGGHYHTTCAREEVLLEIVNQHIAQHNERIEAMQAQADQMMAATAGFTLAAVLDQHGTVIGKVLAAPEARHVTLTDGVRGNATLNARERKLSRSKANICKDAPQLRLHVLTDRVVYEFDEQ
ncbi:hypothetical protein C9426_24005 [Serratia sp. S1B]|nr:hypothetical protein C9426_24005 [Serratia sp. S1B]